MFLSSGISPVTFLCSSYEVCSVDDVGVFFVCSWDMYSHIKEILLA